MEDGLILPDFGHCSDLGKDHIQSQTQALLKERIQLYVIF